MLDITRAHSFPHKILPNSVGQFAKFRSLPRQNHSNSAADCGLPFVSKLGFIRNKQLNVGLRIRAVWLARCSNS